MGSEAIPVVPLGNVPRCQRIDQLQQRVSTHRNMRLEPLEGHQYQSSDEEWGTDSEEEEPDLDLSGRKHVVTGLGLDSIYVCDNSPETTNTTLLRLNRIAEKECIGPLQEYLENSLPAEFLQDEYGSILPLAQFKPHQLAQLQAKLWRGLPREEAAGIAPPTHKDLHIEQVSSTVALIAGKLASSPHVFVLHCTSRGGCDSPVCTQAKDTKKREIVALEPLLNFASLTAAEMDYFEGDIIVFRRNESYYETCGFDLDIVPSVRKSMRFCLPCLRYLWNMRAKAWAFMDVVETTKLLSFSFPLSPISLSSDNGKTEGSSSSKEDVPVWGNGSEGSAVHTNVLSQPLPQLDGTRVLRGQLSPTAPAAHDRGYCERSSVHSLPATLPLRFTGTDRPAPSALTISNGRSLVDLFTPITPSHNLEKSVVGMDSWYIIGPNGSHQPFRSANAVSAIQAGSAGLTASSSNPDANVDNETEPGPASTPPFSADVDMVDVDVNDPPNSADGSPTLDRPGIPRPLILQSVGRAVNLSHQDKKPPPAKGQVTPTKFKALFPSDSGPTDNNDDVLKPSEPRALGLPMVSGGSGVSVCDIPPMVFCSCRKPWEGRMLDCTNTECSVRSYHYKCLTLNEKRASKRNQGLWICEACKLEAQRNSQPQDASTDFKIPFTKDEIMEHLALPRTVEAVRDPYGLASKPPVQYKPALPVRDEDPDVLEDDYVGDEDDEDDYEYDYEEEHYYEGEYNEEEYNEEEYNEEEYNEEEYNEEEYNEEEYNEEEYNEEEGYYQGDHQHEHEQPGGSAAE